MTIYSTKTRATRIVCIVSAEGYDSFPIIKRYMALADTLSHRPAFLLQVRNMKIHSQRIGINSIRDHMKQIATFRGLPNHNSYTSHSGRRTAATLMASSGASNLQLKRAGGWRNMATVDGYVAENAAMRRDTAVKLLSMNSVSSAVRNNLVTKAGTSVSPPMLQIPMPRVPELELEDVIVDKDGVKCNIDGILSKLVYTPANCTFNINININMNNSK